jgi:hypothetical protein
MNDFIWYDDATSFHSSSQESTTSTLAGANADSNLPCYEKAK